MPQYTGNIFIYNNNNINRQLYHEGLQQRGYFLFDTDNLHKFSLYHKEITPNVLLFDFDRSTPIDFIASLGRRYERSSIPLVIVSEAPKAMIYHPAISHYLTHEMAKQQLLDILESYCTGNKHHHILYINLKPYEKPIFRDSAIAKGYRVFEVHNLTAAKTYLEKNQPSVICINFLPAVSQYQKVLSFPKIFYVENTQNVAEIEQFLK